MAAARDTRAVPVDSAYYPQYRSANRIRIGLGKPAAAANSESDAAERGPHTSDTAAPAAVLPGTRSGVSDEGD